MENLGKLGLGCMGMKLSNEEQSILTVRKALSLGIRFFNVGEFYHCGESEIVLGHALKGVPRNEYFLSVKFGVLPDSKTGNYGLDMDPFHIKAHLAYSLARLGVDYIDLYEPARMDDSVPVEEVMKVLAELKDEGLIRHIGLTQVSPEILKRAESVVHIDLVEMEYSLAKKENLPVFGMADLLGVEKAGFGILCHGLLTDAYLDGTLASHVPNPVISPANRERNLKYVKVLGEVEKSKGTTAENIALAWALKAQPDMLAIVGTTSPDHLESLFKAQNLELSEDENSKLLGHFYEGTVSGLHGRDFHFDNGHIVRTAKVSLVRKFRDYDEFSGAVYVLHTSTGNILIDAGYFSDEIAAYIDSIGGISDILLTHGHWDHMKDLDKYMDRYPNTPVHMNRLEVDFLSDPNLNGSAGRWDFRSAAKAIPMDEGQYVISGNDVMAYHMPGHSRGSMMFHFPKLNAIFTGDAMLYERRTTSFRNTGNEDDMVRSFRRFRDLGLPDDCMCYAGHDSDALYVQMKNGSACR